eukprot:193272_1
MASFSGSLPETRLADSTFPLSSQPLNGAQIVGIFHDERCVVHHFYDLVGGSSEDDAKYSSPAQRPVTSQLNLEDPILRFDEQQDEDAVLRNVVRSVAHSSKLLQIAPDSGFSSFLALLRRRSKVLKHLLSQIYEKPATPNKIVSAKERRSVLASLKSKGASPLNSLMRMSVMALFPLVESVSENDPKLRTKVMRSLTQVLQSLPALSLRRAPQDCLNSFRDLLQHLTLTTSALKNERNAFAASTGVTTKIEQGDAASALLGLALQEGSLKNVLSAVVTILKLDRYESKKKLPEDIPLCVTGFLQQLKDHVITKDVTSLSTYAFVSRWQHNSPWLDQKPRASSPRSKVLHSAHTLASSLPGATQSYGAQAGIVNPFMPSAAAAGLGGSGLGSGAVARGGRLSGSAVDSLRGLRGAAGNATDMLFSKRATALQTGSLSDMWSKAGGGSIATDGRFLYVAGFGRGTALIKLGSGFYGTLRGFIYGSNIDLFSPETPPGALVCVHGRLFLCPSQFLVSEKSTGSESDATTRQSGALAGKCSVLEIDTKDLLVKKTVGIRTRENGVLTEPSVLPNYLSITSDGAQIYCLYADVQQSLPVTPSSVDVYSVSRQDSVFVLESTLQLQDDGNAFNNYGLLYPQQYGFGNPSLKLQCSIWKTFCTGVQFVRISADVRTSQDGEVFSMDDGARIHRRQYSSISVPSASSLSAGTSCCYDARHNLVWDYDARALTVSVFANLGPRVRRRRNRPELGAVVACAPTHIEVDGICELLPAAAYVLEILGYLCTKYNSSPPTGSKLEHTLCVEVNHNSFEHIFTILSLCLEQLKLERAEFRRTYIFRVMIHATQILRHNLQHAESAGFEPGDDVRKFVRLKCLLISLVGFQGTHSTEETQSLIRSLRVQCMKTLMGGLSYFYPTAQDLLSLLRGSWKTSDLVLDSLASYHTPSNMLKQHSGETLTSLLRPQKIQSSVDEDGFMRRLLEQMKDETLRRLRFGKELVGRALLISPCLNLLIALQNFILTQTLKSSVLAVITYSATLFSVCGELVDSALEILSTSKIESLEAFVAVVHSSIVGTLLPPVLGALAEIESGAHARALSILAGATGRSPELGGADLSNIKASSFASSDFGPLVMLLSSLAKLNKRLGLSKDADVFLSKRVRRFAAQVQIVETAHPYKSRSTVQQVVVEGASSLSVSFDPRCSSIGNVDSLTICSSNGVPVLHAYGPTEGPSSAWPRKPVIVEGNSVKLKWQCESFSEKSLRLLAESSSRWGFRCTVRGFLPSPPLDLPVLSDIQYSVASLAAKCCQASIFSSTERDTILAEQKVSKWLKSPLFACGLRTGTAQKMSTILKELIDNSGSGKALMEFMTKECAGRPK